MLGFSNPIYMESAKKHSLDIIERKGSKAANLFLQAELQAGMKATLLKYAHIKQYSYMECP